MGWSHQKQCSLFTPPDVAVTVYEQGPSLCLVFTKTCSVNITHELFNGDVLLEGDALAIVSSTEIELTADAYSDIVCVKAFVRRRLHLQF